jgi:hypothetical protein
MKDEINIVKKMYTKQEVRNLCWSIFVKGYTQFTYEYPEDKERKIAERKFNKWFKQNVK